MPGQIYNVPIIPPELRHEEFILQIADSLEYLEKVTEDVFKRITDRVLETQDKLKAINQRTDHAQAKINMLKGSKKAIRVFSSAKYPGNENLESYKAIFDYENELGSIKRDQHNIKSVHRNVDEAVLKEKLQFYSVNIKRKNEDVQKGEGLGKLPKTINSVSSLLLFNTAENPYKKYVIMDPLAGAITKTRANIDEEKENLGDAPSTIANREEAERGTTDSYFYMPGLGEVPEIDVPVYLPNLPNVVDDEIYSADVGQSIAPSLPFIPDLPPVDQPTDGLGVSESIVLPPPPQANVAAPPPPPPPPPPAMGGDVPPPPPPPPPPPGEMPPPPPPPPPPGPPVDAPPPPKSAMYPVESEDIAKPPPPRTDNSGSDGRASLMDAIRNAGGKKLKSGKERKKERKREKEGSVPPPGGGDLMSDLFSKLSMRRKGISGNQKSEPKEKPAENLSPMDKISAMIPPPQKPGRGDSHDGSDWE